MKKRKQGRFPFLKVSRYLILLLVFLVLLSFSDKTIIKQRLVPKKNYYEKELSASAAVQKPFSWDVEKVDEHITKIALPPDPRMSTAEELFIAMNDYRRAQNVQALQKSDLLCGIAQNRSNELFELGELDNHAGFSKYAEGQNEFGSMGEVLFGGSQPQYGVHIVEYGWDRSLTGHREAIRDPLWNWGCAGIAGNFAVFIFGSK